MEKISSAHNDASQQQHGPTKGVEPVIKEMQVTPSPRAGSPNESPLTSTTKESLTDRLWLFELFAWIVCAAGLSAIAIVLYVTEDKPVPTWTATSRYTSTKMTVTINSVISLLATLVKSTLLIPVVAGIHQLKWLWFEQERPLGHIKVFEGASKGPLGSVILLWTLRGRRLACLGAIIVIASLGIDFTLQQLVTYPLRPLARGNGTVARSNTYSGYRQGALTGGIGRDVELPMLSAFYRGLYDFNGTEQFLPTPDCSTGNCTWPEVYTSIGVCSRCADVSSLITQNCSTAPYIIDVSNSENTTERQTLGDPIPYCNYSLPGGQTINAIPVSSRPVSLQLNGTAAGAIGTDQSYFSSPQGTTAITSFTLMRATPEQQLETLADNETIRSWYNFSNVNATECGFQLCVKKYRGSSKKTIFTEQILDTFINETGTFSSEEGYMYINPPQEWTNHTGSNDANIFSVDIVSYLALANMFNSDRGMVFQGAAYKDGSTARADSDLISYISFLDSNGTASMVESIAASMTLRMREAPNTDPTMFRLGPKANGTLYQDVPFVNVRWAWITYPALLVFFTLVFMISTMVENHKDGSAMLWKANSLANFYYPLAKEGRDTLQSTRNPAEAEEVAEAVKVKLTRTPVGYRLVQGQGQA